jgi:hypothetical protein
MKYSLFILLMFVVYGCKSKIQEQPIPMAGVPQGYESTIDFSQGDVHIDSSKSIVKRFIDRFRVKPNTTDLICRYKMDSGLNLNFSVDTVWGKDYYIDTDKVTLVGDTSFVFYSSPYIPLTFDTTKPKIDTTKPRTLRIKNFYDDGITTLQVPSSIYDTVDVICLVSDTSTNEPEYITEYNLTKLTYSIKAKEVREYLGISRDGDTDNWIQHFKTIKYIGIPSKYIIWDTKIIN